jgi:hypothetical protein
MEVKGYKVQREDCGRMILLVDKPKSKLKGTYVNKYINWGESKGWHKSATCRARQTHDHDWFDLTMFGRPSLILPKIQQYRLLTIANPEHLQINCSLLGIYGLDERRALILGAILNSSIALLSRILYARVLGNEGNIQLDVYAAKMMPVPQLPVEKSPAEDRAISAFEKLKKRPVLQLISERRMRRLALTNAGRESELQSFSDLSELDMPDRRELDDAVLEILGLEDRKARQVLIDQLYAYLREFFEQIRQKEEKAIVNKNKSRRKSASPASVAGQLLSELKDRYGSLLRGYSDFVDKNKPFSTFDLPMDGTAEINHDLFAKHGSVRFAKGRKTLATISTRTPEQVPLIVLIASHGVRGLIRVPLKPSDCRNLHDQYEQFLRSREERIRTLIAERTSDEDLQEEIYDTLNDLILHSV